eukprot:gene12067-25294_t
MLSSNGLAHNHIFMHHSLPYNRAIQEFKNLKVKVNNVVFDRRSETILWHPNYSSTLYAGSHGGDIVMYTNLKQNNNNNSTECKFIRKGIGKGGSICDMIFDSYDTSFLHICSHDSIFTKFNIELQTNIPILDTGDQDHCNDKTARIWDIRQLQPDKYITSMDHTGVVSNALFCPLADSTILTTSQNDEIRVYDTRQTQNIEPRIIITHPHKHYQHLTVIKASWHPLIKDFILIGRYDKQRGIDLLNVNHELQLQLHHKKLQSQHNHSNNTTSSKFQSYSIEDSNPTNISSTSSTSRSIEESSQSERIFNLQGEISTICCINKFNHNATLLASATANNIVVWSPNENNNDNNDDDIVDRHTSNRGNNRSTSSSNMPRSVSTSNKRSNVMSINKSVESCSLNKSVEKAITATNGKKTKKITMNAKNIHSKTVVQTSVTSSTSTSTSTSIESSQQRNKLVIALKAQQIMINHHNHHNHHTADDVATTTATATVTAAVTTTISNKKNTSTSTSTAPTNITTSVSAAGTGLPLRISSLESSTLYTNSSNISSENITETSTSTDTSSTIIYPRTEITSPSLISSSSSSSLTIFDWKHINHNNNGNDDNKNNDVTTRHNNCNNNDIKDVNNNDMVINSQYNMISESHHVISDKNKSNNNSKCKSGLKRSRGVHDDAISSYGMSFDTIYSKVSKGDSIGDIKGDSK